MAVLSETMVRALIAAGLAAPSAENQHHVQFAWDGVDTLTLQELLPASQHARAFNAHVLSLIGAGAMMENIIIRAAQDGLAVQVEHTLEAPWRLRLLFRASHGLMADPLAGAIAGRHTNRKWFRSPGLTPSQKTAIDTLVQASSSSERLFWLDQPKLRKQALGLIWRAESERFKSIELHQELFGAVRFDVGWEATAAAGLPPGSLEVEKFMRPGLRMMSHWPVAKALSLVGAHKMMGLRAGYLPARGAPDLLVIATPRLLAPGCLGGGRLLERIWLQATAYGLSVQPLAASCLLAMPGWHGVSEACASDLRRGWQQLIGPQFMPIVLLRIGTADPVSVRTARQALSSVAVSGLSPDQAISTAE